MRRLGQLYGGILQRRIRCGIFLQRPRLRCRIYLHLTCTNSVALQNFLQRTCTNSFALQNFLQRTCTNSRHVAEIICNAICVAKNICNGHAQTVIALQTDLKFFLKKQQLYRPIPNTIYTVRSFFTKPTTNKLNKSTATLTPFLHTFYTKGHVSSHPLPKTL